MTGRSSAHTSGPVMIVTGEASGDMHGARLVEAMRSQRPELSFCGMGGEALARTGVEMLYDAARISVVGLTEIMSHLGDILRARRILIRAMETRHPALLILIDFPDFNLMLGARARKLGIPIFYYISPQVWAWRSGRVRKIGRLADRIGVILPFEKEFYAKRGIEVDFVGHPLVDNVYPSMERSVFLATQGIEESRKIIGLLPGSRYREIRSLLPDFLAAARKLDHSNITFVLPQAPTITRQLLEKCGVARYRGELDIRIIKENRYDLMAACDAAIAASGTVTLELAILGVPTVTCYRLSPRTYQLGRLLIRLDHFSLVNLIGGREIIPELLQDKVTPENIAREVRPLLKDSPRRRTMLAGLTEVRNKLGSPGASERAAKIALQLLEQGVGDRQCVKDRRQDLKRDDETTAVPLVIDGTLDLHAFRPEEVREVVCEYLEECRRRDIYQVRIIHGKGKGVLRRIVHSVLEHHEQVAGFRLAGEDGGSWGATLVDLRQGKMDQESASARPDHT
ncbi:lipid-A-disaccharide synthase [Desulfolithobacter sp.]